MAIVYFDSSAFVKLLVEEDGSDLAAAVWDGCDAAVSSRLAYPEVRAALGAAGRDRRLATRARRAAEAAWEGYWAATRPVELTATVSAHAGQLAAAHALRGADAVHLASALAVGVPHTVMAAWDERLRGGAGAVGLALAPAVGDPGPGPGRPAQR
ncbi:MAG TPA: type II toxin-antitoxin system VapC family toxin [Dermatophilaceae bacterium]|nr:type II toxin-antitoxin system VapC family toxin [Dermatophilaceae bacterium]